MGKALLKQIELDSGEELHISCEEERLIFVWNIVCLRRHHKLSQRAVKLSYGAKNFTIYVSLRSLQVFFFNLGV